MDRRTFIKGAIGAFLSLGTLSWFKPLEALGTPKYHRIVILSDSHLPTKHYKPKKKRDQAKTMAAKEAVRKDINSWKDVERVAVTGDIIGENSTEEELAIAQKYFKGFKAPLDIIAGNHDHAYIPGKNNNGHLVRDTEENSKAKLKRFPKHYGMPGLYYSRNIDNYHLVYLSAEMHKTLTCYIRDKQLNWLREDLAANKDKVCMIFFHAPLKNTVMQYNEKVNKGNTIAQPAAKLDEILMENPQVKFWISGHLHTSIKNQSFANTEVNTYKGRIINIHNDTMDRIKQVSNSMYLYKDKVVFRTYDHTARKWLTQFDREFKI